MFLRRQYLQANKLQQRSFAGDFNCSSVWEATLQQIARCGTLSHTFFQHVASVGIGYLRQFHQPIEIAQAFHGPFASMRALLPLPMLRGNNDATLPAQPT